jgi:hypothetical protein
MSNSNGTSSNAQCNANRHWTACLSKDGCPFHYSSTYMETHSSFAPHNDNYDRFYNELGTDKNGPDDWPDNNSEVSYTGPWYGPDEECPNPEEDPFENYQWLCDNRYLLPTEPGEILEVSPKQFDPTSGEKRPKFPAELYAPDGPWWNPSTTGQETGQLPASQPAILGPIPTEEPGSLPTEEAEDGPATLHNPHPQVNPPARARRRHPRRTHRGCHRQATTSHSRPKWIIYWTSLECRQWDYHRLRRYQSQRQYAFRRIRPNGYRQARNGETS